jgi:hypothetical protein
MAFSAGFSQARYWTEFDVRDEDLDFIYNLLLEREVPLTTHEMAVPLVADRLKRLEREAEKAKDTEVTTYLPGETYKEGQRLLFAVLGGEVGEVVAVREAENPELGAFEVIKVAFEDGGPEREFAASLEDHQLNYPPDFDDGSAPPDSPEGVMERYGDIIEERLASRFESTEDIVRIAGRWFPKALLADINVGHLNLAEAVLDVAEGGPLPTSALAEHLELPEDLDPLLTEFSLDYALQEDDRFDEVGPAGEVQWFLRRLEPPEVLYTPPRLVYETVDHDRSALTEPLLELEERLDDELSPLTDKVEDRDEYVVSLLFPHWRVGALPLSRHLRRLFPTAYEAPRIRFVLIDGHSGDRFPGWVVREERYVFGLDDWYRSYEVPSNAAVGTIGFGQSRLRKVGALVSPCLSNRWAPPMMI